MHCAIIRSDDISSIKTNIDMSSFMIMKYILVEFKSMLTDIFIEEMKKILWKFSL